MRSRDRIEPVFRPGAYGLHLPCFAAHGSLLLNAPPQWEEWQIAVAAGEGRPPEFVDESRARLICEPAGWVEIERRTRVSRLHLPEAPTTQELVQPRLAITAIIAAHWRGSASFHAGAFILEGLAWGVLGPRGAGKSSLLAALALDGVPVLSDDLLIVDAGRRALAGPRCVDLRELTASSLGVGDALGVVGTRERWRLGVDPVPCEAPLGGFLRLEWGPATTIDRVALDQRVATLLESFALRLGQRPYKSNAALMDLFQLPMICLRRPREVQALAASAELVLQTISELAKG